MISAVSAASFDVALPPPQSERPAPPVSVARRLLGMGVHLFTASGVLWAFLAMIAAAADNSRLMFAWLGVALFVDGIDGTVARKIDINRVIPRFSGAALDLVVDYLTYVFVPTYALVRSGLLPAQYHLDTVAAAIILLTSALYFADNLMKTEDAWFRGFPAIWNVAIFYLFLLASAFALPSWAVFAAVVVLGALTFAPIVFVHPFRVVALRPLTITLLAVWSALSLVAIWESLVPAAWVVWTLCLTGAYFLVLGAFRVRPRLRA